MTAGTVGDLGGSVSTGTAKDHYLCAPDPTCLPVSGRILSEPSVSMVRTLTVVTVMARGAATTCQVLAWALCRENLIFHGCHHSDIAGQSSGHFFLCW